MTDSRELLRIDAADTTMTIARLHALRPGRAARSPPNVSLLAARPGRDREPASRSRSSAGGGSALLRRAVHEAFPPTLARVESNESAALGGRVRAVATAALVSGSRAADRAELRRAVQPVYDELRRDALTRDLIARIEQMRRNVATGCASGARTSRRRRRQRPTPSTGRGNGQ